MKKFLSLLLAVIMLLGCLPAMAEEGTFTANADKYMITVYKGTDENLVVPASVDGAATPIVNRQAVNSAQRAVTLSFEEGVTQIRSNNIDGLNITQLTLPSTLEVIGSNNIYQTDKLTEVTVPAAVSYVGNLAFSYCDALTKVTFTGLCPVFAPRCFVSTASGLVVYVPDDQLDAYKSALPEGLNIQPSGQKAVDARVRVAESDFEFDAATGTIKKYNGTASYIEIPATIGGVPVKTIGAKTFYNHPFITVVIVPEGVETLEMYSIFAGAGLYHVELPSTLKTIGNNALWGNDLDGLTLPEGLEAIGKGAFTNALEKIDELIIPDSVTSIGEEAFMGCMPVKIVIGANVQSLPATSFSALHYATEIVIRNMNGMTIDPKAFQSSKKGATITLMDGINEEVYNSYVEQLAVAYESATVNQPELAVSFPKLDAEAGAPFIGNWTAVAASDGTDFFGMDLLGISMTVALQADGTGNVDMDGDAAPGSWYVENGAAIFAPILEEGGKPVPEEAMPFTLDENGRMCLDLGGIIMLMEKDGAEYAVPAIPEKPWPELDAEKAQAYLGTWDAVNYIMDGETYAAELVGPTTLILNADGTAQMIEGEEEAYELRWYAEDYSAYIGPTMSALAELYFDMNGDLQMKQDNTKMIMKPHVEAKVITGADELLGDWYDDLGNKLTVTNDGKLTVTYASDGWVRELKWDMVDGAATVTEGLWVGCPIVLENGIVIISGDNAFQLFSVDGDLSAYYGEDDEDDMPVAQPIGEEGEAYFGTWTMDLGGMAMNLTLNQDGTCTMEMMGEAEPGVWTVENGNANVMGDMLYIDGDGNLIMESQGMVFTKVEGADTPAVPVAQPIGEEGAAYFGTWTLETMAGMSVADMGMTMELTLSMDGTATIYDGYENDVGVWTMEKGVAMVDGSALTINGDGKLVMSADGMDMIFAQTSLSASGEDELTEEEMMALLALLAAAAGNDSDLPEAMQGYVGTWHMCYAATGGLTGDLRDMGITATLVLNADGTGSIDFPEPEKATWYDDDGVVRFGESGMPMTLLEGGFLQYGSNLGGYLVFHQDAEAVYTPQENSFITVTQAPVVTEAPAVPSGNFTSYEDRLEKKFVAKTYTSFGQTMDASMLGAEYSVLFHANGTCDFGLAGMVIPNLPWGLSNVAVGLGQMEAFAINYYGTMFNAVPTDAGFDMDYYGTMTLHFVLAE